MSRAIYFTPWYEYPVDVQKTILMLLHASLFNSKELWIGHFAPLNVQTALQVREMDCEAIRCFENLHGLHLDNEEHLFVLHCHD